MFSVLLCCSRHYCSCLSLSLSPLSITHTHTHTLQTYTQFLKHILSHTVLLYLQVELGKGYTSVEWREDLKKILRKSAEGDSHAVFLFTGED